MERPRRPSLVNSLLLSRWGYIWLTVVVVLLYAWLFATGPSKLHRTVPHPPHQESASADFWKQDLEPMKVLEALRRKPQLALGLALLSGAGLILGGGGLILSALAIRTGRLSQLFRYKSRLPLRWSLPELIRILVLLLLVAGLLPLIQVGMVRLGVTLLADVHLWSLLSTLFLEGFLVLVVWGFATTKSLSLASALGLSRRGGRQAVLRGIVGYVAIFPWVFGLLWLIVAVCQSLGIQPPIEPIQELVFLEPRGWVVGMTVVLACVVGPITEEIFFRGIVFAAVRKHTPRLVAMLLSGSLFAALHTNPVGFLPILLLGCLLADAYERTGSLLSPMAVHMVHNTLLMGVGLTMRALLS